MLTNLDILRQAGQFAIVCATKGEHLEPEEAWYRWSIEHGVTDAGARYIFEAEYAAACSRRR